MTKRLLTTNDIDKILEQYASGTLITRKDNILYRGISGTINKNINISLTYEEMFEYSKSYNSPIYFIEKYCGIKLFEFQKNWIVNFTENKFNIYMVSRETGFTNIMSALYLWYMIFNINKNIMISSYNRSAGVEFIDKIFTHYKSLPVFIKPGLLQQSRSLFEFTNGCKVSYISGILMGSLDIDILCVLDFSKLSDKSLKNIYVNNLPGLRQGGRVNLMSRPNGVNTFYELVSNSERLDGDPLKNNFKVIRTYWWEVTGRDLEWKNNKIKDLGSESFFSQEYDLSFTIK